jgi:hypothetical protein
MIGEVTKDFLVNAKPISQTSLRWAIGLAKKAVQDY